MVPNKLLSKSLGMGKRNHINKFHLKKYKNVRIQEAIFGGTALWGYLHRKQRDKKLA
jgi:hypothetical protein